MFRKVRKGDGMKKAVCPKCGSENVVKIMYGLPISEAFEAVERGKYVLGGCCVMEENRECRDCKTWFVYNGGTFVEDGY